MSSKRRSRSDVRVYEQPNEEFTMTQYAITLIAPYDPEDLDPPAQDDLAAHDRHSEDLPRTGVMVGCSIREVRLRA
jgi:hypothetical protein